MHGATGRPLFGFLLYGSDAPPECLGGFLEDRYVVRVLTPNPCIWKPYVDQEGPGDHHCAGHGPKVTILA